jgi:hypothetical protein
MRAVLRAERAVAGPLNRAANSDEAASVLLVMARAGSAGRAVADRGRAALVHALSLPSHRDVQVLDVKVEQLRRALEELAAERRDDAEGP